LNEGHDHPKGQFYRNEGDRFAEHVEGCVKLEIKRHQGPEDYAKAQSPIDDATRKGRVDPVENQTVDNADPACDGKIQWAIGEHQRQRLHFEQNRNQLCALSIGLEKNGLPELEEKNVADDIGQYGRDSTAEGAS